MDGIIILTLALFYILTSKETSEAPVMKRETKLNPDLYECEDAFMEVAKALGFH